MDISLFDYNLPKKLIANTPARPRDRSRLLVADRENSNITHHIFSDLPDLITENDVLVFNSSKVFPARLRGKKNTGGKTEILLLHEIKPLTWEVLRKGKLAVGQILQIANMKAYVKGITQEKALLHFDTDSDTFWKNVNKFGLTPLPPYIDSLQKEGKLRKQYQTVYADKKGSSAAPTAGLHFTEDLLNKLDKKGIQMEYVTLHVGLGTFAPIKEKDITKHQIHEEYYYLDAATAGRLNIAKKQGKRIIAVGTTTVRVLETCVDKNGLLRESSGKTSIYIYPPYKFKFVDGLITNFHLPKSTLLALVSAFVSHPNTADKFVSFKDSLVGKIYSEAIKENYRFYSFGDSMLIL